MNVNRFQVANKPNSYRALFSQINQQDAWDKILGFHCPPGQRLTSPFRPDKEAHCYLRTHQNRILFSDHADKRYNKFTCVHALAHFTGQGLMSALKSIHRYQHHNIPFPPLAINDISRGIFIPYDEAETHIEIQPFRRSNTGTPILRDIDVSFWRQRDIPLGLLTLPHQPVFSVHHLLINGREVYPETYPVFAYYFPDTDHTKAYAPNKHRKRKVVASNTKASDVWRFQRGSRIAVLTKSYKDAIELFAHTNFDVFSFQGESIIHPNFISYLNLFYDKVIILYDNDKAGYYNAWTIHQYLFNSQLFFYPRSIGKDTDDLVLLPQGINLLREWTSKAASEKDYSPGVTETREFVAHQA